MYIYIYIIYMYTYMYVWIYKYIKKWDIEIRHAYAEKWSKKCQHINRKAYTYKQNIKTRLKNNSSIMPITVANKQRKTQRKNQRS